MIGTLRTFDAETRTQIHQRVTRTAETIARSSGASARSNQPGYPVTVNDPALTHACSRH